MEECRVSPDEKFRPLGTSCLVQFHIEATSHEEAEERAIAWLNAVLASASPPAGIKVELPVVNMAAMQAKIQRSSETLTAEFERFLTEHRSDMPEQAYQRVSDAVEMFKQDDAEWNSEDKESVGP